MLPVAIHFLIWDFEAQPTPTIGIATPFDMSRKLQVRG